MNIFLIGASGLVSGTLARMAVEAGHAVTAVSRGNRPVPNGVKSVTVDRHDQEAFKNAIEEAGDVWDLSPGAPDDGGLESIASGVDPDRQELRLHVAGGDIDQTSARHRAGSVGEPELAVAQLPELAHEIGRAHV